MNKEYYKLENLKWVETKFSPHFKEVALFEGITGDQEKIGLLELEDVDILKLSYINDFVSSYNFAEFYGLEYRDALKILNISRLRIYDNGGETFDRYTAIFLDKPYSHNGPLLEALSFSENPYEGMGQHTCVIDGTHLGERIQLSDLPKETRQYVESNL